MPTDLPGAAPERPSPGPRRRRQAVLAVALLVAIALPLYSVALHWSLAGRQPWAFDEPTPEQVVPRELASDESWPRRYPPLHRHLLRALMTAALPAATAAAPLAGTDVATLLHALGRALSVSMAVATLLLVYAIARRLGGDRAAFLAGACWLGVAPQAYYAKTMNLDAPYLFWFALALYFFVRFASSSRGRDLVGFALAGGCALLTKDQAYGLFVLPGLWIVASIFRQSRQGGASFARSALATLGDRRLLGAVATLALLAAVAYRVWDGWHELTSHLRAITGHRWMARYRQVPGTFAGQLALARQSFHDLAFCCGWFGLAAGVAGAAREIGRSRREPLGDRAGALLLLFPVSYYLTFLAVVRYSYDRFLLPVALVLAVVAGPLVARATEVARRRATRLALSLAVAAGLAFGVARAVVVDLSMLEDSRLAVERLTAGRGRVVAFGGLPSQYPRSFARAWGPRFVERACRNLRDFDFVAYQPRVRYRPGEKRFLRLLESGAYGFRPVPLPRFEPPRWLYSLGPVVTNLRWIDEGVLLFERDPRLECRGGGP